nr:PrsW family glutamic-type intramembrane protease [Frondihabitans sucicola]
MDLRRWRGLLPVPAPRRRAAPAQRGVDHRRSARRVRHGGRRVHLHDGVPDRTPRHPRSAEAADCVRPGRPRRRHGRVDLRLPAVDGGSRRGNDAEPRGPVARGNLRRAGEDPGGGPGRPGPRRQEHAQRALPGGAVGLGFAALEDLAYAVNFYENPPAQLHLTHLAAALVLVPTRALLTPFLHPLYTALFAAALFASSKNGKFRITWRVVLAYLGVSLAHGLWDGGAGALQHVTGVLQLALAPVVVFVVYPGVIVGTGLIWIKVARRARFQFHTRVLWWLAPPPGGGPAAPGGPGLALPPVPSPVAPPAVPVAPLPGTSWPPPASGSVAPGSAAAPDSGAAQDGGTLQSPPVAVPSGRHSAPGAEEPEAAQVTTWPPPAAHTRA